MNRLILVLVWMLVLTGVLVTELPAQPPFGRGRGGFDPSGFLDRLDRNHNGVLDPDEQEGPAQFLIRRLESVDSSIKAGSPIPIDKIKGGFAKMRGQRGEERGGEDRDRGRKDQRRSRSRDSDADKALQTKPLVPGFGGEETMGPLMGFGAAAELLTAEVTDADRIEARKRMAYFDKNKDGFIAKNELTSQFAGNPMDFDRNRDAKLSLDELAVRYARRREGREAAERDRGASQAKKRSQQDRDRSEAPNLFNGRKSYRSLASRSAPEGVPGFFIERDQNKDGQVSMAEFTDQWNDDELKRFFESDFNQDGVITAEEAIRNVEEGPAKKSVSGQRDMATSRDAQATGGEPVDTKYLAVAKRIISRRDKNKDGALTISEWKTMLMSPVAADTNQDGRITAEEYARWTLSRERKR